MKNIFLIVFLFISATFYAQNDITITHKKCIPKKGFHLKLQRVLDDSRCPEGVTCIWAGEVSVIIEVYKNKTKVEEKTLLFNTKNKEENITWFLNYLPKNSKKIKEIAVFPYPKEGQMVKPKSQYIKISF
jgi:hypothetical protein